MVFSLTSDEPSASRAIPLAGLVSLVAHGGLFWVIAAGARALPEPPPLSPLRFSGQTFDVDAIGDDRQNEATAPSDASAPGASGGETVGEPSAPEPDEKAIEPEERELDSLDVAEGARALIVESPRGEAAVAPLKNPNEPKLPAPAEPPTQSALPPAKPQTPIDPFDLALPGESAAAAAPSLESDTGSYGAETAAVVVSDAYKAFLHVLPEANRHSPVWKSLPVGALGRVTFSMTIGDNARLVGIDIERDPNQPPPELLVNAILKARDFLRHQRLAWEGERRDGTQRLALTMRIEKRAPHPTTPEREHTQRHGRYGEARPNAAFFTYYDGQHIHIELERVP